MGDSRNTSEYHSEIVPDSTTRDSVLRKLLPTRSMESIEEQPSSPSKPYSMSSSSLATTSSKTAQDMARPASRWAKSVTYGRKKDPLPEENDTEPESDAMDVTDTPFPSTSRATFTTPAPKPRGKTVVISPSTKSHSPSPKLGDGSDSDEDDNVDLGNSSSASKFGLTNWRTELNAIDQQFDEEEEEEVMRRRSKTEHSRPSEDEDAEMDDSTVPVNPPRAANLHLTSSLSTLSSEETARSPSSANKPYRSRRAITTLESSSEADEDEDPLGLTSAHTSRSHRPIKKRAIMDSDEEGEAPERPTKLSRRSLAADTSRSSVSPQQAERMFDSPAAKIDGSPPSTPPEDPDATAAAPDVSSSALSKTKKGKRVSSTGKPKKLSKKEQHNMWMETEILKAQAPLHVPEEEREQPRLSMTDLFQRIGKVVPSGHTAQFNRRRTEISSDPIVDSSQPAPTSTAVVSSGATFCPETPVFDTQASGSGRRASRVLVPNSSHASIDGSAQANRMLSNDDEDDDGMLPDLAAQIKKEDELRKKERAQKELKEKKLLWAQQQRKVAEEKKRKAAAMLDDDDEEELEIEEAMADSQGQSLEIVESQHGQFNTGEQLRKAVVKDRLHAAISPFKPSSASKAPKEFRHPRKSMPTTDSFIEYMGKTDLLGVKSKPVAPKSRASMPMIKRPSTFGPVDLKSKLLQDVRLADAKIRRDRDEEWEGRGGHAGRKQQIEQAAKLKQIGGEKVLEEWAKKGIEVAEAVRAEVEYEDDEEADEEDEDYKPEEQETDAEMDEDEQQGENVPAKVERSRSSSQEPNTEDEDKENRVIEDKENVPPPRKARAALADKDDLFSPHQPSEAEDEPEDKENAPPPRAQDDAEDEVDDDDLFGLRPPKKHTARRIVADDEDEDEDSAVPSKNENIPPHRSPLKFNAFDDDDERLPRPQGLPFGGAGGKMLMFNSSAESLVDGGAEKEQATGGVDDGFDMSDADAEIEGDGFSQLFALESKPAGFDALRRREPLDDMDLESQKLLPVMDLSTQEMQKDDAIFEQDQIVRAEIEREERQKTLRAQTKMYLNEDGFFTQTKPATQTPIDFPGDSQGFFTAPTTIGDDVLASQEQDAPLRRLRRGHVRQESEDSVLPSTILATAQTETKRDAFSVLMTAKPKEPKKKDKEKEKQMREFFQDQADESDEDKIIGFGDAREDENDEDEENDKHLEGLVDDKQIERSEVNEQAVIEKHQEQIAQDDAALEKYHLAATKGEYRGKKRDRGIGLSDDESDADDDANRRRRLALRKKRVVIGGDQLEDLANNERTSAFYKTYEEGIAVDEENDFGYIPSSEQPEPEEDAVEEDEDEEGADYEEEKGDEPTKSRIVNTTQLKKELLAAIERDEKPINPHDLGWVDRSLSNYEDDMDDEFSIKEINDSRKPAFRTFGQAEVDEESRRETIRLARLGDPKARTQPRREDKGATYGVSKAGTAITSHASKSKASSSSASSKAGPGNRPLTKGASLLQRVPTKQGGFDS